MENDINELCKERAYETVMCMVKAVFHHVDIPAAKAEFVESFDVSEVENKEEAIKELGDIFDQAFGEINDEELATVMENYGLKDIINTIVDEAKNEEPKDED